MLERDARRGPRVLFVDEAVPLPRFGAGLPRTRALIDALGDCGCVVTFLPRQDRTAHEPETSQLRQVGVEVLTEVVDVDAVLAARAGLYDAVLVARPQHAPVIASARFHNRRAAILYDAEAVFSLRDALAAAADGDPLPTPDLQRRIRAELEPLHAVDAVLTVSEAERRILQHFLPGKPVAVCGHAVPVRPAPPPGGRTATLFVGNLATPPNEEAVVEILDAIWPEARRQGCGPLVIVGAGASDRLAGRAAGRADVVLAGPVDDLGPVYDGARAFLAPHRFAAGIPLKVIEAMANGVPCVVSPLLAEQLGVRDGVEVLVAAESAGYAAGLAALHRDDALWLRLQAAAQAFVAEFHSAERLRRDLGACLASRLGEAGRPEDELAR